MDNAIVMFVLIVTLSRAGNSSLAFSDVGSANDNSNGNTPVDTEGFEKNVKKAEEPLVQLIPMGNIEEIEKFGKREIEQSNKLPSLSRRARCKYPRISWRSRKAKNLWGVSTTPLKHIPISGSASANGGLEDSFRKADIGAPSIARARHPTNKFDDARTTKRENEHGVEEIIMLPPQTVDSVVVISEGARTASNETQQSYVCGSFDTKEEATQMSKEQTVIYTPYEARRSEHKTQEKSRQKSLSPGIRVSPGPGSERLAPKSFSSHVPGPAAISEPIKIDIPLNSAREKNNPHYDRNDKWSREEIFQNFPLNDKQMTPDIRLPFGINQNVPFPHLEPEIAQKHISHPSYAGKSMYQDTLVGGAMIQRNRNLDEPLVDDEDSLFDGHDVKKPPTNNLELEDCIKNYGLEECIPVAGKLRSYVENHQSEVYDQRPITWFRSVHGNPLTEQPDNDPDVHVPTTTKYAFVDSPEEETTAKSNEDDYSDISTPGNVHEQNVDYASISEDETKKQDDASNESNGNKVTTSVPEATEVPEIDGPAHPAMGMPSDRMAHLRKSSNDHAGKLNQVIGSAGSPEDVRFSSSSDELKRTTTTSIPHSLEDESSSTMATAPGDRKLNDLRDSGAEILRGTKELSEDDDYSEEITPSHVDAATNITKDIVPGNAASSKQENEDTILKDAKILEPLVGQMANNFRAAGLAGSLKQGSSTNRPRITDDIALARRLLLIPEVQHLALQDTKLFLSDMEDLSTFGLSMAQVADETFVTLLKNVVDSLSTAIEAHLQPVAQLAGKTASNGQQTLPDKNLKQYIKNLLHYSGLTAEGVQSEATKNILFRTIQHTLQNAGFKVNNAHIWDTLKSAISQNRLPRMNPIPVFPTEDRTSMIRSTDMPDSGFKRLPFIPVKERVFKNGRWAEKSTLLGSSGDRPEPKSRKAQSKKFHSEFTTEHMDRSLLAHHSGKTSLEQLEAGHQSPENDAAIINDVAESAAGKSSPAIGKFVTNERDDENIPIKYYSPAGRLLAYRKKIQVPKVMFQLEEKTKVSPRAPRLSLVADSSFPVTSTTHQLPPATENGLKFTKDWSESTLPTLPYTTSPSSEKFREKPDSLSTFDLHDDHEDSYAATKSETGFKTIPKDDPAEQKTEQSRVTESSLGTAKNSKRGTWHQQIPNKQMIVAQDQVSNHEQSSLTDRSPSTTPEYDPTYFGKISLTSAKSPPGKMSDLSDTDLFYIGDGVKIPLRLTRTSDGFWGLSISPKICETLVKQKCPCNVPSEGDIVEERRREKKNSSFTQNTGQCPIPKNHFLLDGIKRLISDVDNPKERRTRSSLETDLPTTSSSPVTEFIEKYNLALIPQNISNSSGPWQNSATLNNNTEIIGSMKQEKSLSTTPDSKCTENGKRTMNDVSPKNEPQSDDEDVTESSKNSNVPEDGNWTIVRGSNETINGVSPRNENNDSRNAIDRSMNSTNVRDPRSMMEYHDDIIERNVLNLYDVPEREDSNIMGRLTTHKMNSHSAKNLSDPMSSRSPGQPEPSKIDNVLRAGNYEDRWSWVRDFVDSRRKHNVVMNSQDMDEAILLKIDNMLESENTKVMENPKSTDTVKNLNPMLDHGKMGERKFRKIGDSSQTRHTEFGLNSIDSSKESQLVRNGRPRAKHQDPDEPNRETLIDKKNVKERDDHNFSRISKVKAKYNHRRDNSILKRTRFVKKQKNARPYRYQQYIDEEAQERMDVVTGVLYWLKEVFFEPSVESDD